MIAMPTFYFEFEDDQRRDVSVCNYGLKLSTGNNAYQMNTFAGMGVGNIVLTGKRSEVPSDSKRDFNWPILRYSDVLLMYAEALNELNNGATPEAEKAVEDVRLRAFNNDASKLVQFLPVMKNSKTLLYRNANWNCLMRDCARAI